VRDLLNGEERLIFQEDAKVVSNEFISAAQDRLHMDNDISTANQSMDVAESLDKLFEATAYDFDTAEEAEPLFVETELRQFQKQGLHWMMEREEHVSFDAHPDKFWLWKKRYVNPTSAKGRQIRSFQKENLNLFPRGVKRKDLECVMYENVGTKEKQYFPPVRPLGGILADEMGLGKTLQILSLILTNSGKKKKRDEYGRQVITRSRKPTLIVCPLSVITNWVDQLDLHSENGAATVYVYHGAKRTKTAAILKQYDIVITTFQTIAAEHYDAMEIDPPVTQADFEVAAKYGGIGEGDFPTPSTEFEQAAVMDREEKTKQKEINSYARGRKMKWPSGVNVDDLTRRGYTPVSYKRTMGAIRRKKRFEDSAIFKIDWLRVVLDEAHVIREARTRTSLSACLIKAERRWCLSGTPIQNRVDDLFSLMRFMKMTPFDDTKVWRKFIALPIMKAENTENKDKGFRTVQMIMSSLCLRRRKHDKIGGEPLVIIPPKVATVRSVPLDNLEKDIYAILQTSGQAQMQKLMDSEGGVFGNYAFILEMLLRLRQACNHYSLVPARYNEGFVLGGSRIETVRRAITLLAEMELDDCSICCEPVPEIPTITPCGHVFCKECIIRCVDSMVSFFFYIYFFLVLSRICFRSFRLIVDLACDFTLFVLFSHSFPLLFSVFLSCSVLPGMFQNEPSCPNCRAGLSKEDLISEDQKQVVEEYDRMNREREEIAEQQASNLYQSSKIRALFEELARCNHDDPEFKAVIFSQWTSMLDILEIHLKATGVKFCRIDGKCSNNDRRNSLRRFRADPEYRIFLISLKAGGVGLNLTTANKVFLIDPWWNPAAEEQAIDRVHRLGQTKDVEVIRIVAADTVESRIIEIQNRKKEIFDMAINKMGSTRRETREQRLNELKELFNMSSARLPSKARKSLASSVFEE